jgi:type I restriction enzyme S subunit
MPQDLSNRRVWTARIARIAETDAQRLSRHRVKSGDIIYSRRGDVERHALIGVRESGWLCGTGCLLVRMGADFPSPLFVSLLLDSPETRTWIVQHAVGATMPNLNTGILARVPIAMPDDALLLKFEDALRPMTKRMINNDQNTEVLASLRDTLLPKLISGELRMKTAEKIVEAVA